MNDIETDFLIIGSGIAGLSLAIKLSEIGKVAVVTKRDFLEGSTQYAQGGVAAVMSESDSFEQHLQDTLKAGAGLCKEEIARGVVQEGPERIRELMQWGMTFTEGMALEGGHSQRRVLHAGDATGAQIARTLLERAKSSKNIEFFDWHVAIDLITTEKVTGFTSSSSTRCFGAYVMESKSGKVKTFVARCTFLATGGAGKVYLYTSNPDIATGDGMAMAYRAGATMANMEFVQFHPTCLYHPDAKSFLISEAVRGEGGILKLSDGSTFMEKYDPMKELASRDIVARAIDNELKKRGDPCVYLDIRHKGEDFIKQRFPMIYERCLKFGIDITKDQIPVVPAAHYFCGGVVTDAYARTTLKGLWAVGEVASTGLHGANRLASNSLLEGLVFAHRAYQAVLDNAEPLKAMPLPAIPAWNPGNARTSDEQVVITQNWDEIRALMWNYVGIVRSDKRLDRAWRRIQLLQREIQEYYWDSIVTSDLIELRNIATVAELVIKSAMLRKESRGLHYNLDYPNLNPKAVHDTILVRNEAIKAAEAAAGKKRVGFL